MTQQQKRWREASARYRKRRGAEWRARHSREEAARRQRLGAKVRKEQARKASALHRQRHGHKPLFRAIASLRSRLVIAIRSNPKASTTLNLLGCTPEFFRAYIEARFKRGMNWENYGLGKGRWHIDHVIPCAEFDLSDPRQQRQCFRYTNLQPLWGRQNYRKGAKCPRVHQGEIL